MLSMRKSMKLGSSTGCRHYNTLAVTGLWPWRQTNLRVLEILLHCMWKGEHNDWMCTWIHINLTAFKCRDFFSDILLYTKPVKSSPHLSQMTQIHPQSILAVQHQDLPHVPPSTWMQVGELHSHHTNRGQSCFCLLDPRHLGNSLSYLWMGQQALLSCHSTQNIPLHSSVAGHKNTFFFLTIIPLP